jgi:hypothetical protein
VLTVSWRVPALSVGAGQSVLGQATESAGHLSCEQHDLLNDKLQA